MVSRAERATSFGSVAEDYDRLRPQPSDDAIAWLLPSRCAVAVDLAAGTGLPQTGMFGNMVRESFWFTRPMTADDFTAMLATYSTLITATEDERAAQLARVRGELDRLFPGATEIEIPMRTDCWRADRVSR